LIPDSLLNFAETAINRAIKTDALAATELATLAGKSFAVECQKPPIELSLSADTEGITLSDGIDENASVILAGNLPALMSLATSVAKDKSDFANSGVEIRGDVGALLQLSRVLSRLDIDWEDLLGSLIGEIPARLLFLGKERLNEKRPYIKDTLSRVSTSFFIDQVGIASSGQAVEFRDDLRQLQYRIDRVQARIRKIQNPSESRDIPDTDGFAGAAEQ
jgi:ubiquinone biosynthesis accessory factor UbiJ